jgi:hypothetical protein
MPRRMLTRHGARTHQRTVATHEQHQGATQIHGEKRHRECCHQGPYEEGVPFPLPDVVDEPPRVMAEMFELAPAHWESGRVEEFYAKLDEWKEQEQVERRRRMDPDLGCDLVETEGPCKQHYQHGRDTDRRVDPDDDSQCQAPRKAARRHSTAELAQQRPQDFAAEKFADGLG